MNTVPMFDVIPVTGPNQGQGRVCYVCKLGSAPAVVAFIKPESLDAAIPLVEAIQRLSDLHAKLQAFVVYLGEPDEGLKQRLRALAEEKNLAIPLTVLPEGGLPASVPISPDAANTVLLYRGRQIVKKAENVSFHTPFFKPLSQAQGAESILKGLNAGVSLESSPTFMELDEAAAEMLARP